MRLCDLDVHWQLTLISTVSVSALPPYSFAVWACFRDTAVPEREAISDGSRLAAIHHFYWSIWWHKCDEGCVVWENDNSASACMNACSEYKIKTDCLF